LKISNDNISVTGRPINFVFGSSVGFPGSTDPMALFLVHSNPRWRPWHDMIEDLAKSRAMSPFAKLIQSLFCHVSQS